MKIEWKKDLLKEGSLWQVYVASRKLRKSRFNEYIYIITGVIICLISARWITRGQFSEAYKATMLVADIGFDLSVQILGFLIGGFAIFATVTDHRLMIKLAETPMGDNLSVFKNVFFNFLAVFYVFLLTLTTSVITKIVGGIESYHPHDFFSPAAVNNFISVINSLSFFIMTGLITLSIVRLKSFIWNIYQAFITFLAVADMMDNEKTPEV